jgi:hypothetical protein
MNSKDTSRRREVLPEEEYTSTLGSIIREQYFPDILDLERQVAVHDRRMAGDFAGAVAVRRAARRMQEHQESVRETELEQETSTDEHGCRKIPRPLHRETVTGFHERVTSEDNAEFDEVQRTERIERDQQRNEYLLLTDGSHGSNSNSLSLTTNQQHRHPLVDSPLLLASDMYDPMVTPGINMQAPVENSLFFVPRAQLTNTNTVEDSTSRLLMPPPLSRSTASRHSLVAYIPKSRMEKKIEPSATRFSREQTSLVRKQQHLEGNTIGGSSSYESATDASTDLDSLGTRPLSVELQQATRKRQREMETYVQMTPLIAPNQSPIITWGHVAATPMALNRNQVDDDTQSFALPEASARDQAAARALATLEERTRRSRATPCRSQRHGKPSTTLATALLAKSRPESARSSSSFGTALRVSYSKSAASLSSANRSSMKRRRDHANKATPQLPTRSAPVHESITAGGLKNITDGLLQLSK